MSVSFSLVTSFASSALPWPFQLSVSLCLLSYVFSLAVSFAFSALSLAHSAVSFIALAGCLSPAWQLLLPALCASQESWPSCLSLPWRLLWPAQLLPWMHLSSHAAPACAAQYKFSCLNTHTANVPSQLTAMHGFVTCNCKHDGTRFITHLQSGLYTPSCSQRSPSGACLGRHSLMDDGEEEGEDALCQAEEVEKVQACKKVSSYLEIP